METGEKIRMGREARGWSQADLAKRVSISQPAINKIETGDTRHSRFLPRIAQELGLDIAELIEGLTPGERPAGEPVFAEGAARFGPSGRDFPIHASAEGGPGQIIVSSDAVDFEPRPAPFTHVRDAYGLLITGTSMEPEYRPGDTALINPNLPVIGGEVYVFYAEKAGEARATIKHLRRAAAEKWLVSQWNPPAGQERDFALSRKDWQWAHRVIGKYSRR
ncbi:MAG TPA: helix-turn-helix domain-containing protein [Xanthobacteraceae bacterium]|nr:helix-turn-helix domain-containing protein [Xanthobacteraceae bacterium]